LARCLSGANAFGSICYHIPGAPLGQFSFDSAPCCRFIYMAPLRGSKSKRKRKSKRKNKKKSKRKRKSKSKSKRKN